MGISSSALGSMGLMQQGAGSITNAAGAYFDARMRKQALRFQAATDRNNAALAELGAEMALENGQTREQQVQLRTARQNSTATTAYSARGIDLAGGGSPARVMGSNSLVGEINANIVASNAIKEAFGYRTQKVSYENDALMADTMGDSIHPFWNGMSTLLNSSGDVASSWYSMGKTGMFGGGGAGGAAAGADAAAGSAYNFAFDPAMLAAAL